MATDNRGLELPSSLILVTVGGLLAGYTALHGLNEDQLLIYEAALRAASGQSAYLDYSLHHGPLAAWLAGVVFSLAPTGGIAWACCSALLNATATLLVARLVRRVSGPGTGFVAGLLTAVWFLPPFGSYYSDHLAYTCLLLAAYACICLRGSKGAAVAGCFLALSFHAKQTVGIAGTLAFMVTAALAFDRRTLRSGLFSLGSAWLATHSVILLIVCRHGADRYLRYVVIYPMAYGSLSPDKKWWRMLSFTGSPWNLGASIIEGRFGWGTMAFIPAVLAAYLALVLGVGRWRATRNAPVEDRYRWFALVFLLLSTLWGAAYLGRLHLHLFFGMGGVIALLWNELHRSRRFPPWTLAAVAAGLAAIGLVCALDGNRWVRNPDPFLASTDLRPIRIERSDTTEHVRMVTEYLASRPGGVFVMGGINHLVMAALRRPSLQQTLIDSPGLTFPRTEVLRRRHHEEIVSSFAAGRVMYILGDMEWAPRSHYREAVGFMLMRFDVVFRSGRLVVLQTKSRQMLSSGF